MALFINELKPLRMYSGKFYYPIDMKDRTHNSLVYLLTPHIESSIKLLNSPNAILNKNTFYSYFIEKNVEFVINKRLRENSILVNGELNDDIYSLNEGFDLMRSYRDPIVENGIIYSSDEDNEFRLYDPISADKILNEATNYNSEFRNLLYGERLKTQQDCVALYDGVKKRVPYIKKTYINPSLYKNLNLYYDWSYYTAIFFKNSRYIGTKAFDMLREFLDRYISDGRFYAYNRKTIVIPVLDWVTKESDVTEYMKHTNPISMLWRMIKMEYVPDEWAECLWFFYSDTQYFTLDFMSFSPSDKYKVLNNINQMIANNPKNVERINIDSKSVILHQLADRLDRGGIKLTNLTGGTKTLTKDDLNNMGLLDNPEASKDPEVKKAALVNRLDKAASKSTNADEALKDLDKPDDPKEDDWIKDIMLELQQDEGIKMDKVRKARMDKQRKEMLTKTVKGKSVKQLLDEFQQNNSLPEESIPIDTIDDSWHHIKFTSFNKTYDMNADIVAMFTFFNTVTHPMNIVNLKVEDSSTSEDYKETWTCVYEDAETGKRFNMILDIPKLIDNRFMKLRGNEKILNGQLMLLPIIKTGEDTVQMVSNYNKIFFRRKSPNGLGKSTPIINKLSKALDKYEGKDIKILEGNNKKIYSRYEVPVDLIDIGTMYARIDFKDDKSYINFNLDDLKDIPFDRTNLPTADKKLSEEDLNNKYIGIYVKDGKKEPIVNRSIDQYLISTIMSHDKTGAFAKLYNSISVAKRLMYSEASILQVTMPTVVIIGYNIGLQRLLDKLEIDYRLSETRPNKTETYIKFKDGYLVYNTDKPEHHMLLNGLMECDMSEFSIKEINSKDMWLSILDDFGGRIKADGLDNFYDLMIDPITKEVCQIVNLPDDYIDGLIYANDLLVDNKYNRHSDITGNRLRTNEVIVGHLYLVLSKAFGAYRNMVKRNKGSASFSAKKSAVIDSILNHDQTSSDLSTLTPLLEAEAMNKVTFKGLSGMNSDRAFSLDKRTYDKSMLGVLSLSTGFAGTVGVNRQTTINSNVLNKRGFISPRNPKELNNVNTFSIMEAMSPLAITHNDPVRTAMAFTQTSQHQMLVRKSMPNLITTGCDEALPYLTSNKFSYKFKGKNGVVREVTKDYMIIEDLDTGKKDMIDLRETIRKNSDGGFYITTKLDTTLKPGTKLKYNDICAYDHQAFSNSIGEKGNDNSLSYNIGTLAKVAIMNTDMGFEDSCVVDSSVSEALGSEFCVQKEVNIDKNSNVYNLVKIGQKIQEGDPLLVFQDAMDEKEANELLLSLSSDDEQEALSDLGRKQTRAKNTGIVQDIKIFRTCDIDKLSPTLQKIVKEYESKINKLKRVMVKNDIDKQYILEPTYKLANEGKLKNLDGVRFEFYIKVLDKFGIGDKLVFDQALKGVNSYVIEKGQEPYTDYRPNESVNAFLALTGVMARMVSSSLTMGLLTKLMVEVTRKCQEDLGIKWRPVQEIITEGLDEELKIK